MAKGKTTVSKQRTGVTTVDVYRKREGTLPGGAKYEIARKQNHDRSSTAIARTPNKTVVKRKTPSAGRWSESVEKRGTTPGGRSYVATHTRPGSVTGEFKSTKLAPKGKSVYDDTTHEKQTTFHQGRQTRKTQYVKPHGYGGLREARTVKKGPTKPVGKAK